MKSISYKLLAVTIGTAIISFILSFIVPQWISFYWFIPLTYFYLITLGSMRLYKEEDFKNTTSFVYRFQRISMLRFLCHIVFVLVYMLINRSDIKPFVTIFMIYYLIFTAFELIFFKRK